MTSREINDFIKDVTRWRVGGWLRSQHKKDAIDIEIVEGVAIIESYGFCDCKLLTNVIIPNTVTEIGMAAFKGCSSLSKLVIPNSVTKIGYEAFLGCHNLTIFTDNDYVKKYCMDCKINVLPSTKNNDDYYIKIGKAIANYYEEISFDRNGITIYTDNKKALYGEITNALESIETIQ